MKKTFKYLIKENNISIEQFLLGINYPKSVLTYLKNHNENIFVNGINKPTTFLVKNNDELNILIEIEDNKDIITKEIPIDILYEDEYLLIVNKQPGLPVHPSKSNFENTLANGIKYYYNKTNQIASYHCITRIDTDTTGAVLIGKDPLTASYLNKLIQNDEIKKTYLALVNGEVNNRGNIILPIGKNGNEMKRVIDYENGQYASTSYKLVDYDSDLDVSLVNIKLKTGRTHQIRVHFHYLNHSLIGDKLYNPDNNQLTRCGLHVNTLCFVHPFTKEKIMVECTMPNDMKNICLQFSRKETKK